MRTRMATTLHATASSCAHTGVAHEASRSTSSGSGDGRVIANMRERASVAPRLPPLL